MALAQERFSTDAGDDELDPQRPSSTDRARKAAEPEGQLARMVREVRELEDGIVAKLTAAQRQLSQLESRRVHEDAGYGSAAEFEQRMLASTPALRAMREAVPSASASSLKLSVARRESADARTRQTKALTTIARALERIRALDGEIYQCAVAARAKLDTIEGMRVFDECGYASFEEFLERALGPSPVLAGAVALAASDQCAHQAADRPAPVDGQAAGSAQSTGLFDEPGAGPAESTGLFDEPAAGPAESTGLFDEPAATPAESTGLFDEPGVRSAESVSLVAAPPVAFTGSTGLFDEPATSLPETDHAADPSDVAPDRPASDTTPARAQASTRRRRFAGIIVSVVLCAAATVAGTAAGVYGGHLSEMRHPAEPAVPSAPSLSQPSHVPELPPSQKAPAAPPTPAAGHKGSAGH